MLINFHLNLHNPRYDLLRIITTRYIKYTSANTMAVKSFKSSIKKHEETNESSWKSRLWIVIVCKMFIFEKFSPKINAYIKGQESNRCIKLSLCTLYQQLYQLKTPEVVSFELNTKFYRVANKNVLYFDLCTAGKWHYGRSNFVSNFLEFGTLTPLLN